MDLTLFFSLRKLEYNKALNFTQKTKLILLCYFSWKIRLKQKFEFSDKKRNFKNFLCFCW